MLKLWIFDMRTFCSPTLLLPLLLRINQESICGKRYLTSYMDKTWTLKSMVRFPDGILAYNSTSWGIMKIYFNCIAIPTPNRLKWIIFQRHQHCWSWYMSFITLNFCPGQVTALTLQYTIWASNNSTIIHTTLHIACITHTRYPCGFLPRDSNWPLSLLVSVYWTEPDTDIQTLITDIIVVWTQWAYTVSQMMFV